MTAALSFEIRPLQAGDWELVRCVRLAALADAPDAFARTLDEELQLSEASWRDRATRNAQGLDSVSFLALREGVPCGMVVGVCETAEPRVQLNALWVAQNVRRRGLGAQLVERVCSWAAARGAREVVLEVTTSSRAAIALYRSLGFSEQGELPVSCGARRAPALRMSRAVSSSDAVSAR